MSSDDPSRPEIAIVGAGMSGLCLAIQLKRNKINDFVVLEKSSEVGGTWLENNYPNAGCDIPSFLYSFSFAPKYDWSEKYARQPEILQYFRDCCDRFDVRPHIRFEATVESAIYDETQCRWQVTLSDGSRLEPRIFVSAVGQLNRPTVPELPGLGSFRGQWWHSARWNHDCDLRGKKVGIVGSGSSAIQFIPDVARIAAKTYLFQRTPCWIYPLKNYRYARWANWLFRQVPGAARLHRWWIFLSWEKRYPAFKEGSFIAWIFSWWFRWQMWIRLPRRLWDTVIPKYAPGCKRVVLSSDYLQSLQEENVELIQEGVSAVESDCVHTQHGKYKVDALIFATGFDARRFLHPMRIFGRGGVLLHEAWQQRPRTLLGIATNGFPNLYFLYGPNTNLGHNSVIFMVECQVDYLLKVLHWMKAQGVSEVEARREAVEQDDAKLQRHLARTVWAGNCTNWYKIEDGHIVNNWSGSAIGYWLRTRRPDFSQYVFRPS